MEIIRNYDIESWAVARGRDNLPKLIYKLIFATISPTKLRMPYGESVWMPGFDGIVDNDEPGHDFVPEGRSVWEVGSGKNFKTKAEGDYSKRSQEDTCINKASTTFVFVTPYRWVEKTEWEEKKKQDGLWKNILVIDGEDLKNWFGRAPAVAMDFVKENALVPREGCAGPDDEWDRWSDINTTAITEELVLAGREKEIQDLRHFLAAKPGIVTIRADSPGEAVGFALAVMRGIDSEPERIKLLSRVVVVKDEEVAFHFRNIPNLILLIRQALENPSRALWGDTRHVIAVEGPSGQSRQDVIKLPRPNPMQFAKCLENMGASKEQAMMEARDYGFSVTIYRRQRNMDPGWGVADNIPILKPAILAGRWNETNKHDQSIIEQLAGGENYEEICEKINPFRFKDDPPLRKTGDLWTLSSYVDALQCSGRHLRRSDFERLCDVFQNVFSIIDSKTTTDPKHWRKLDFTDKGVHSNALRLGLAETMLFLAERGKGADIEECGDPRQFVEECIRKLPGLCQDWRVIISLRDQLQLLMEAAPNPLLDCLETLLQKDAQGASLIFAEDPDAIFGSSLHSELLWGLEMLAWSPQYLSRASFLLARLAEIDPGGRLANRPINSLGEIFSWWHPGTTATTEQRLQVLDAVCSRHPTVGWQLLVKLFPEVTSSVSFGTARPHWRDDGLPPEASPQYSLSVVERAIPLAGLDALRWKELLQCLRALDSIRFDAVLEGLQRIDSSSMSYEQRVAFWDMLREVISSHRSYPDAHWSLKGESLERVEAELARFVPEDPTATWRWLFDDSYPDLPDGEQDFDRKDKKLCELRAQAVAQIISAKGFPQAMTFGAACGYPGLFAQALASHVSDVQEAMERLKEALSLDERGVYLASQLSGEFYNRLGQPWQELVLQFIQAGSLTAEHTAAIFRFWPSNMETWQAIETLGQEVQQEYWKAAYVNLYSKNIEELVYGVEKLQEVGRFFDLMRQLHHQDSLLPSQLLLKIFDGVLKAMQAFKPSKQSQKILLSAHDISGYLGQLRSRKDISREDIARREYAVLPILGHYHSKKLTLHEFMASDPAFFIEVICDAFRPKHESRETKPKPTEIEQSKATNAYTLLQTMNIISGHDGKEDIDPYALSYWIDTAKELATKKDRIDIVDRYIGRILAHSPEDHRDTAWPHQSIRDVLEKIINDDIKIGIVNERFNMRGVYTKAMYEGGNQERELADQANVWASIVRTRWPRTAEMIEDIVKMWEYHGRLADESAEKDKLL